jgi:uncharacterized membrane protein
LKAALNPLPAPPSNPNLSSKAAAIAASKYTVVACFVALVILGLLWELWLAPLRPGGTLLALKVIPIALAIPALIRGSRYAFQWWSMLLMIYLTEGLVRATSDKGLSANLAWIEVALCTIAFFCILFYTKKPKAAKSK